MCCVHCKIGVDSSWLSLSLSQMDFIGSHLSDTKKGCAMSILLNHFSLSFINSYFKLYDFKNDIPLTIYPQFFRQSP